MPPSVSTTIAVLGRTAKQHQPVQCDCPKLSSEVMREDLRRQVEEFPWGVCQACSIVRRSARPIRPFSCALPQPPLSEDQARRTDTDDRYMRLRNPHSDDEEDGYATDVLAIEIFKEVSGRYVTVRWDLSALNSTSKCIFTFSG
jgi:hypothetical protein